MPHLQPLLGSLRQLRTLFLVSVSAAGLPQHVGCLDQLRALHLSFASDCGPEVLAAAAGLTNLQHLGMCLTGGVITSMPSCCTALVHLTSLDLSGRVLTQEALDGVCSITGLRSLNLRSTHGCSTLPNTITHLANLHSLWLKESSVSSLPECLTALTALGVLGWSCSAAVAPLPLEVVWRLKSLYFLYIEDQYMASVPAAISSLTGLLILQVGGQALTALPTSISALKRLDVIQVFAPQLRALPDSITALTQLKMVRVPSVQVQEQPSAVQAFLAGRQG
jgi:hypothetical protein